MKSVRRNEDGQLLLKSEAGDTPVHLTRCFPWQEPWRYLSLRDEKGTELALVEDLRGLERGSREALEQACAELGFVFEIEAVDRIEEEYELRLWDVRTRQGKIRFQTALDAWPVRLRTGGILIRDIAGNLFHIGNPGTVDARSREVLGPFLD